jgi:hypothetical protein
MENRADTQTLLDAYRTPGFRARAHVDSYALEPPAFVITLERRQKKPFAAAAEKLIPASTTGSGAGRAILAAATTKFISTSRCAAFAVRRAA